MNVLVVGGSRTAKTVQVMEKNLGSSGVNMMTENYIEDVQNVYNRGDSFDKLIVIEQAWTHNGQYNFQQEIPDGFGGTIYLRDMLISFIQNLSSRYVNGQQFVFLTASDEAAEIIQNEIVHMYGYATVVVMPKPISVKFMVDLVLKDVSAYDPQILYHPQEISGEEEEGVDTQGFQDGFDMQDQGYRADGYDNFDQQPNPEFTPDMGESFDYDPNFDTQGGDPFSQGQGGDPFNQGQGVDQFDQGADPFNQGQGGDPFNQGGDQFDQGVDPFSQGGDPFSQQGQEPDPFAGGDQEGYDEYQDTNNGYGADDDQLQVNSGGQTVEIPNDMYGYGNEPYTEQQADPYAQGQEYSDPYGNQMDPYGSHGQPDPFSGQDDSYKQAADPFASQDMMDPYAQPTQPQGQKQKPKIQSGLFGKGKNSQQQQVAEQEPILNPQQNPYADEQPWNPGQQNVYNEEYVGNPYEDSEPDIRDNIDSNVRVLTDINLNDSAKLFAAFANRGNSIMVTGAPGAGTQTVAFQLANLLRLMNYNVLLVDFDVKGRQQTYISQANYNATDHDESRLVQAVNSTQGINQYIAIAAQNLHLLNLGLDIDDKPIEQIIQKNRVMKFANQAKNGHNFVIYDVPFDFAAGHLEDITTMADNIVIVQDSSTWGSMKTLLYMMNVGDDAILETLFGKAQILFNRYRNFPKILGEKIRRPEDILKAMDKQLTDLVGADIGYSFRGIHVCGCIPYIPQFEEGWLGKDKAQWTATKEGQATFVEILKKIVFRDQHR